MPAFICTSCGTQYPKTDTPPDSCLICQDERHFAAFRDQLWTTMPVIRQAHFNAFRRHEPGLMGIGTVPTFGFGQRALLVRTAQGNVLWDCVSLIDDDSVALVNGLGGISAIAVSHPHCFASMVEWSHAFSSVPIHVHAADRKFVPRLDSTVDFWEGETREIASGLTLIRCGGHFGGATVLHWAAGAGGRGALLTSDVIHVGKDANVSFMRSYTNLIPLDADSVWHIEKTLSPWPFDAIYGRSWDRVIPAGGKEAMARSVQRYIAAISGPPRG